MPTETESMLPMATDSEASCADCTAADVPVSGFRSTATTSGSRLAHAHRSCSQIALDDSGTSLARRGTSSRRRRLGRHSATSGGRGLSLVRTRDACRRICRKYRRVRFDQLQDDEYNKLRRMVPALRAIDKRFEVRSFSSHRQLHQHQQQQQCQHQQPQESWQLAKHEKIDHTQRTRLSKVNEAS